MINKTETTTKSSPIGHDPKGSGIGFKAPWDFGFAVSIPLQIDRPSRSWRDKKGIGFFILCLLSSCLTGAVNRDGKYRCRYIGEVLPAPEIDIKAVGKNGPEAVLRNNPDCKIWRLRLSDIKDWLASSFRRYQ